MGTKSMTPAEAVAALRAVALDDATKTALATLEQLQADYERLRLDQFIAWHDSRVVEEVNVGLAAGLWRQLKIGGVTVTVAGPQGIRALERDPSCVEFAHYRLSPETAESRAAAIWLAAQLYRALKAQFEEKDNASPASE
jgi:hypothetical protein